MTGNEHKTEHASESADTGSRPMGFGCFASHVGEATAECPCGFIMRKHRVASLAMLVVMGLAAVVICASAALGIIGFLRTI